VPILGVPVAERYPFVLSRIRKGEITCFSSVSELPPDAPDRDALEHSGTKSATIIPLIVAGRVIGSLGFTCTRERSWDPAIVNRLRLVAAVLSSALARKRADAELRSAVHSRIAFESLIADLSSQFVNLDSNLIDGAIEQAQQRIVLALDVDRSTLFQLSADGGQLAFSHFWARPGMPTPDLSLAVDERFPWVLAKVMKGELVSVSDVAELPDEAAVDRASFEAVGTKSNVTIPLTASGRTIGALTFAAVRHGRRWTPEVINRLRLIAEVFASALARKRAEAELRRTLEENMELRDRLSQENTYLRQEVHARGGSQTLVTGPSAAIRQVLEQVAQVAPTGATVLLLGETGTGKELIATAIHEQSARRIRPMVRVNCAAIPVALIESELFGREKGAYTGALARQAGRFELANGSTIFLDEIGELTADVQVKLLRVLQEKQIDRLGGSRSIDLDLRVIAATNRDLDQAVADGTFREDLYYRLNVFAIRVPPLRERAEDIPTLVWAFVDEFSKAMGKRLESISKEHMVALQRYSWPGNIRELRNVVEHAVIISKGPRLAI
jgi:transcriptional regulator with GAF, ATPase, and Fis domain